MSLESKPPDKRTSRISLTFELLQKLLPLPAVIKDEGFRHEVGHREARGAVLHRPRDPLVLPEREQEAKFVGDEVAVGDVVHQLFALPEGVEVDASLGLRPSQLEVVEVLVHRSLPAHVGEGCLHSARRKLSPSFNV